MNYIKMIKEVPLWNAGYCSLYDFSKANSCEEAREEAICKVARVCRGDKTPVKTDEELYQQLLTEHDGKPGSVFEFVPACVSELFQDVFYTDNAEKFGFKLKGSMFSNLRALMNDGSSSLYNRNLKDFFVFKVKIPQMIVKHILRHRMLSFQEMSERTNKLREYYYCDELKPITGRFIKDNDEDFNKQWNDLIYGLCQKELDWFQKRYRIRQELLNKSSHGLAYATLWIAGWKQNKSGWDNFFAVRTKNPAQREVIDLAEVMKQMMEE